MIMLQSKSTWILLHLFHGVLSVLVEDEFRSLTAWGNKYLLYPLPDGSRVNRLCLGGCCLLVSFGLCADVSLHRCHWCSVDGRSNVLVVLITLGKAFLPGPWWTMPICDVTSQNVFYCCSLNVDQNLAVVLGFLSFHKEPFNVLL